MSVLRSIGMPQPRKYDSNAERQAAYRARKAKRAAAAAQTPEQIVVNRVMAADAAAAKAER